MENLESCPCITCTWSVSKLVVRFLVASELPISERAEVGGEISDFFFIQYLSYYLYIHICSCMHNMSCNFASNILFCLNRIECVLPDLWSLRMLDMRRS